MISAIIDDHGSYTKIRGTLVNKGANIRLT